MKLREIGSYRYSLIDIIRTIDASWLQCNRDRYLFRAPFDFIVNLCGRWCMYNISQELTIIRTAWWILGRVEINTVHRFSIFRYWFIHHDIITLWLVYLIRLGRYVNGLLRCQYPYIFLSVLLTGNNGLCSVNILLLHFD